MRRREFVLAAGCALCAGPARAGDLVEPHIHFVPEGDTPEVVVTLDACMGETDHRILDVLVAGAIPATIFATGLWLARNPDPLKLMLAHSELFDIQDHGARHLPAVIGSERPYGLVSCGTASGVFAEVMGGAQAVQAATGRAPTWFRGAAAVYTQDALSLIATMGLGVAGFSLNGDLGASVGASTASQRIGAARSGDIVISHINQPKRPAGAGVAQGLLTLKARGFRFRFLRDVAVSALA